jgi:hypothetical protein
MAYELLGSARTANVTVIAPGGSTVGFAGFIQGGGHSSFTSYYGLAADAVLALNIVTADGRYITVDPDNNEDLFWAIRGGGAGKTIQGSWSSAKISRLGSYYFCGCQNVGSDSISGVSCYLFDWTWGAQWNNVPP